MVLIWGVQGNANPGQEHMVERTDRYLRSLKDANEILMVPTPVAMEYLRGFDNNEREAQLTILGRYYFLPSFDIASADLAAELSRRKEVSELHDDVGRHFVKTDVQIVATAIVHQADVIITNNVNEYRKIAGGRISISDIPNIIEQTALDYSSNE